MKKEKQGHSPRVLLRFPEPEVFSGGREPSLNIFDYE